MLRFNSGSPFGTCMLVERLMFFPPRRAPELWLGSSLMLSTELILRPDMNFTSELEAAGGGWI